MPPSPPPPSDVPPDASEPSVRPTSVRAPRAGRLRKQEQILLEAERLFARFGFEGVSLDDIASALGVSRQNMLYYYASKDDLYTAVLDSVLAQWLQSMSALADAPDHEEAIRSYIRAKLRFSQERPSGSAVFTREVMSGAPRYGRQLQEQVVPHLRRDVAAFERWAQAGVVERIDFTHLMFLIWSVTQAYADLAPQFALFMDKPALDAQDFDVAHETISQVVIRSLRKR